MKKVPMKKVMTWSVAAADARDAARGALTSESGSPWKSRWQSAPRWYVSQIAVFGRTCKGRQQALEVRERVANAAAIRGLPFERRLAMEDALERMRNTRTSLAAFWRAVGDFDDGGMR